MARQRRQPARPPASVTGVRIAGWGAALPETVVTNDDLSQRLETSDAWITERTGIKERRIGGTTSGLAREAGSAAMDSAGTTAPDIDLVIVATCTPDQIMPATAATVQHELGIDGAAFDINAVCSGFVYGLVVASGLISAGLERILLVGSDTMSGIVDWDDRSTAILFADGAGAVVIEATDGPGDLLGFDLDNDGSGRHLLAAEIGGVIKMDGREVFRRAVRSTVDSSQRALERAGLTINDVTLMIPHQANIRIIDAACRGLGLPIERAVITVDRHGNTSAASIPLALADAADSGRINDGDILLLVGFGAGMSVASVVIRWTRPHIKEHAS
ncbi:MAG: beta-ketoacyl-ACP synthase III [Actinomycetes bacterium]